MDSEDNDNDLVINETANFLAEKADYGDMFTSTRSRGKGRSVRGGCVGIIGLVVPITSSSCQSEEQNRNIVRLVARI